MSRREVLRMGLGMLGAAVVAPLATMPAAETRADSAQVSEEMLTSTLVELPSLAPESLSESDLRYELTWRTSHMKLVMGLAELADATTPETAARQAGTLSHYLRSDAVIAEDPDAAAFMASMIEYLYGRRAQGLPAWEPGIRDAMLMVIATGERQLGRVVV